MANPPVGAPDHITLIERLRRELRNPSMVTVGIIIAAVLIVPLALLVPSWISTTQGSFQSRSESEAFQNRFGLLSSSVLVPSLIVPWMLDQVEDMEVADSPTDWHLTSFTAGPCDENNLSQLPEGQFADAIANSCTSMNQIQIDHSSECPSIQVCNISDRALERLAGVRTDLLNTFSDADFVIPYRPGEEASGQ